MDSRQKQAASIVLCTSYRGFYWDPKEAKLKQKELNAFGRLVGLANQAVGCSVV